jgi:DNA-directed RNA polymerase specialized sigma subunit
MAIYQQPPVLAELIEALGVETLSDFDRSLVGYRLGWSGAPMRQAEAAKMLGISQTVVSKRERLLTNRLRRQLENRRRVVDEPVGHRVS